MATYNRQILNTYFKNRDWFGAADYLSTLQAADTQKQAELISKIKELRRQGEIQNALLEQMDDRQKDAFNFISAYDGNTNIPQNSYGSKYMDLINNLKQTETVVSPGNREVSDEYIKTVRIELDNDIAYKNYLSNLGLTDKSITKEDLSVKKDSKSGKWIIDIPTDNIHVPDYYNAALDLDHTYTSTSIFGPTSTTYKGKYSIKGITTSNIILDSDKFNSSNLYQAYVLKNQAKKEQDEAIASQQTISPHEEVIVTPFLGHGHANAYKLMSSGIISKDDYKKIVEERTDVYNSLLRHAGLHNKTVYTTQPSDNDKEGKVFKQIEDKDKDEIMQHILVAMDDKRLSYAAAMHDGEVGTYITISPATDKNKDVVGGKYGKGMRIFIPGLFKSSCDESFNSDTKQMSVRDNADMRRWNYGKFLKNGQYVGYDKNIGAYQLVEDENGEQVKRPISTEDMLQKLDEENIIDTSVSKLLSSVDANGQTITFFDKGKLQTADVEDKAMQLANVGTNELYPKGKYSDAERLRYANELFNTIMEEFHNNIYKRNQE